MNRSTIGCGVAGALVLVLAAAPLASAHVTVSSDSTAKGSGASLTFRVPTERDDTSTTAIEVDFPTDHPLTGVSVLNKPGWSFSVTRAEATATPAATGSASPAATPTPDATASSSPVPSMNMDSTPMPGMDMNGMSGMGGMHGNAFVRAPSTDEETPQAISSITWHINSAVSAIPPGGYDLFTVRVSKLPDTDALTFKALQTYGSGEVVRWIDEAAPGTAEPEHPAPILHLTAATSDDKSMPMSMPMGGMTMTTSPMAGGMQMAMGPSRDDTVNTALGLGIAGLFFGLVAGTLGSAALARTRGTKSGT
jgi:uncharacterized protein